MTKLDYGYKEEQVAERPAPSSVDQAKTALSKQSIANLAILNSMPTQPAAGQTPPAQTVGFGRTR